MLPTCRLALAAALALAWPLRAAADLQDEIQVYTNDIGEPGERGLELHVNTTPRGRSTPDYPGEVTPQHGLRVTPEFSWGLTRTLEAGLYLPLVMDGSGHWDAAGLKLRLKWLPWRPAEGADGGFGGLNLELSRLAGRYSASRSGAELRSILGWRGGDWLLAVNPTLGFDLSDGYQGGRPELSLGVKVSRRVAEGLAAGAEWYAGTGPVGRPLPRSEQDQRLFLALDVDRKPWFVNLGLGRALTDAADRWTVKAIFELPFD